MIGGTVRNVQILPYSDLRRQCGRAECCDKSVHGFLRRPASTFALSGPSGGERIPEHSDSVHGTGRRNLVFF